MCINLGLFIMSFVAVMMCCERLKLLEICIRCKPMAYRNTQRQLQLAHKLHVCGKDKRLQEGQVLVRIQKLLWRYS
jgi:hypothetical protein